MEDQLTELINTISNFLGIQINEPLKAFITAIVIIVLRFIERKNLKETINRQESALDSSGIPIVRHKNLFRKIWEFIRFKRFE